MVLGMIIVKMLRWKSANSNTGNSGGKRHLLWVEVFSCSWEDLAGSGSFERGFECGPGKAPGEKFACALGFRG